MNKSDLLDSVLIRNQNFLKDDVSTSINLILELISGTLSAKGRVEVRGFGTFSVRERKSRIARNPKTGKSIAVQTKNHPYFRASKRLKESINN